MPTKKGRITTNLDRWLYDLVVEDAKREERSEAQQAAIAIKRYYLAKQHDAELFRGQQSPKKSGDVPVYGTPPPEPGQSSKRRGNQGKD